MILGCGTSNLGIDIYNHYNQNINMVQMDVSSKLIYILKNRNNITNPNIEYILDDTMHLNTVSNNSISSIIDKGFMDSLYYDDTLHRNCHINSHSHINSHTNSHTTLRDNIMIIQTIHQIMKMMYRDSILFDMDIQTRKIQYRTTNAYWYKLCNFTSP